MFSSPYSSLYPRHNFGGSPFYNPSYYPDSQYHHPRRQSTGWGQQPNRGYAMDEEEMIRDQARALAQQRARRAQWLPDEVDDADDDWEEEYNQLRPHEKLYVDAAQRRQQLEQQQKRHEELALQKALDERRWQQQLEQRQNEDDERRRGILEQQRRLQQQRREAEEEARLRADAARQQARSRSRSPATSGSTQIPIQGSSSKPPSPSPERRTPTPVPQYEARHEEAASRIQTQYRIHRSFKTIHDLEKQFDDAKSHFTYPSSFDFQKPAGEEGHISVPVHRSPDDDTSSDTIEEDAPTTEPKLAYSSNNFNLLAYLDSLLKLLTKLDGVESWGDKEVRNGRRSVVKRIEREMSRVDRVWKGVWHDYVTSESESQ